MGHDLSLYFLFCASLRHLSSLYPLLSPCSERKSVPVPICVFFCEAESLVGFGADPALSSNFHLFSLCA